MAPTLHSHCYDDTASQCAQYTRVATKRSGRRRVQKVT